MSRYSNFGRLALTLVACSPVLLADGAQTGALAGVVKDGSGAPVAGVRLRIESPNLQGTRQAVTNANGEYRFMLVPPGAYKATVTKDGFQTVILPLTISLNQSTRADIPLTKVGAAVVEVIASGSTMDTQSVTNQTNVTREVVDRLPVGRTYQGMMLLTPGVTGGSNPNVLGGYSGSNIYPAYRPFSAKTRSL